MPERKRSEYRATGLYKPTVVIGDNLINVDVNDTSTSKAARVEYTRNRSLHKTELSPKDVVTERRMGERRFNSVVVDQSSYESHRKLHDLSAAKS